MPKINTCKLYEISFGIASFLRVRNGGRGAQSLKAPQYPFFIKIRRLYELCRRSTITHFALRITHSNHHSHSSHIRHFSRFHQSQFVSGFFLQFCWIFQVFFFLLQGGSFFGEPCFFFQEKIFLLLQVVEAIGTFQANQKGQEHHHQAQGAKDRTMGK